MGKDNSIYLKRQWLLAALSGMLLVFELTLYIHMTTVHIYYPKLGHISQRKTEYP